MVVLGKDSSINRFFNSSFETLLCSTGIIFNFRHPHGECSINKGATYRVAKISG